MVTEISLNTICGHIIKIIATKEGKLTHIHIKTTCKKLRKWGTHFDMEMKDFMGGPETILSQKTAEAPLTPTCLVPATVIRLLARKRHDSEESCSRNGQNGNYI